MKRFVVSTSLKLFFLLVVVSCALILLDQSGRLRFAKGGVERFLVPVEKKVFQSSFRLRKPFEELRYLRSGVARIADLERQVAQLTVDAVRVETLEEENESMRKLLGASLPVKWTFVVAPIIGRGEVVSVGAGKKQGIGIGDAVVWEDALLGSVEEVSEQMSILLELNNPESKVSVYIPRTGAGGILVGRFGSQVVLSQVLQGEEVKEGDVVVTTGAFGAPRGLVVGKIVKIISDETDIYKEALVEPLVSLKDFNTVFVVKEK